MPETPAPTPGNVGNTVRGADAFEDLAEVYEALIDWPKRLANEEPFYRQLGAELEVRRVLDAACGVGRHAGMFHGWGWEVQGADLSPAMLTRAQANFPADMRLSWVVRGFHQPHEQPYQPYDLVICVGNSLALVPDEACVRQAVARMLEAVRPGGALLTQVLNVAALPEGPCIWQRSLRTTLAGGGLGGTAHSGGGVVVVKGVHRVGGYGYVELVVVPLEQPNKFRSESVRFLGLTRETLASAARDAGAAEVEFFGGYQRQPFDPARSGDLMMLARK